MSVGRDARGRFLKGQSPKSPGRPRRETEHAYLEATIMGCSLDDWAEIVKAAVRDAKKGDPTAREWLTKNILGLPVQRLEHSGGDNAMRVLITYSDEDNGDRDTTA